MKQKISKTSRNDQMQCEMKKKKRFERIVWEIKKVRAVLMRKNTLKTRFFHFWGVYISQNVKLWLAIDFSLIFTPRKVVFEKKNFFSENEPRKTRDVKQVTF